MFNAEWHPGAERRVGYFDNFVTLFVAKISPLKKTVPVNKVWHLRYTEKAKANFVGDQTVRRL